MNLRIDLSAKTQAGGALPGCRATWVVSAVSLILLVVFSSVVLATHAWDAKAFVMEGTVYRQGESGGSIGYDGQFAYYMALDPLDAAGRMDKPAYRYQRVLYPLSAWALSIGGQRDLLPWAMLAINLFAMTAIVYLVGRLLEIKGAPVWLSINVLFFAGSLIAVRADLNEPLAMSLALAGWLFIYREQWKMAGACLALAVLAKETALVFALGIAAWLLWRREWRKGGLLLGASLLPALLWDVCISLWLGATPWQADQARMVWLPFYGLKFIAVSPAMAYILLWVGLPAILFGLFGLYEVLRREVNLEVAVLLANVALIAFMPQLTWINVAGALRAAIGLWIAALIFLAYKRSRWLLWSSAYCMISGLILLPALIYTQ
jgi:hypothetical protein